MKLTLNEIVQLDYELNGMSYIKDGVHTTLSQGILKQKTSMKNKLYFQRLNKLVKEEVKIFEDTKKELFEKLGKQKENDLVIPDENIEKPMEGKRMGERLSWSNSQVQKLKEFINQIKNTIYEIIKK